MSYALTPIETIDSVSNIVSHAVTVCVPGVHDDAEMDVGVVGQTWLGPHAGSCEAGSEQTHPPRPNQYSQPR